MCRRTTPPPRLSSLRFSFFRPVPPLAGPNAALLPFGQPFPLSTAENSSPTFKFHRDSLPSAVPRDSTILLNLRLALFHPSRHVRLSFFARRFDDSFSKSFSLFLSLWNQPPMSKQYTLLSLGNYHDLSSTMGRIVRASERDYQLKSALSGPPVTASLKKLERHKFRQSWRRVCL